MRRQHAFTLIELLVAVAVVAIVLTIAVPSFFDYLLVQRLKSINAQLVTDFNFARSEAVTRNTISRVVFDDNATLTCYTIFTNPVNPSALQVPVSQRCDCKLGPGLACSTSNANAALLSTEIRTVQVLRSSGVTVLAPGNATTGTGSPAVGFNNVTGGLLGIPNDQGAIAVNAFTAETAISSTRLLRTVLGRAGRPTVCSVGSSLGASAC